MSEGCDRTWTMPQLYPVLQDRCRISGEAASSLDVWMGPRQAQSPTNSLQKTHSGWSRRREQGRGETGVRIRNRECRGQRDRKEGWRGSSAVKNCTVLAENLSLVPVPWSGSLKQPVTLILEDRAPSSGSQGYCTCVHTRLTHIHVHN